MFSVINRLMGKVPPSYETRFEKALKRTEQWGLASPEFQSCQERFANEEALEIFTRVVQNYLSRYRAEEVSQQCFAVTCVLKEPLEKALGLPLAYTLGYVKYMGHNVFYTEPKELKTWLQDGITSPATNLHAWLTLPSHEIIDITFATTIGVVRQEPEVIGRMGFLHPDNATADMQYHPQLVGEDYLVKIGAIQAFYF